MSNFSGTPGNDVFTGSGGNDIVIGGAGADNLSGGDGDDVIYSGDQEAPYTYGGIFRSIDTGSDVDTLQGGDGTDRIFAGYGDNVDGGANGAIGDYLYINFQGAPSGVTFNLSVSNQVGGATITGIEYVSNVIGSQYADNITGYALNGYANFDTLSGGGGADTVTADYYTYIINGDDGDDVLDGRGSQYLSAIHGGAGNDLIYDTNQSGFATMFGDAGDDTIYAKSEAHGGAGNDVIVLQTQFSVAYGDDGNDKITATAFGSELAGGAGSDTLVGGDGADVMSSGDFVSYGKAAADMGTEHDELTGGAGNDDIAIGYGDNADGGAGVDSLRLSLGGAAAGVTLNTASLVGGGPVNIGGGIIQNFETLVSLRGTEFADTLTVATQAAPITVDGGAGDDVIIGQGGAVYAIGGAGNDRFVSGSAADTFDGGAGVDTIDYSGFGSSVHVNLVAGTGAGGDSLVGVEGVIGSAFADQFDIGARSVVTSGAGGDLINVVGGSHSGVDQSTMAAVTDWTVSDQLHFGATTGAYTELTAGSYAEALGAAHAQEAAGYAFVAVQVAFDVYVFGEPAFQRSAFDGAVKLVGANLDQVSAGNIGLAGPLQPALPWPPLAAAGAEPTLPGAPGFAVAGADGSAAGNFDTAHLTPAGNAIITSASSTFVNASVGDISLHIDGFGIATDANGHLAGGTATAISYSYGAAEGAPFSMSFSIPGTPLTSLAQWLIGDNTGAFLNTIFAGADHIAGSGGADLLRGYAGNDQILGGGGADTVWAGTGNDIVYAEGGATPAANTYLRGEDGDDYVVGGRAFDDINGNKGNDTVSGGEGNDWVVGGQDQDLLFGDNGDDIVYGNIGADTLEGGNGADWVRGGQGDDVIWGDAGDDFMSGDRGDDVIYGGAGADRFNLIAGAAIDQVMDFKASEGDYVTIEGNLPYVLSFQSGSAVIDIGNGDHMILVGVANADQLGANWLHPS